MWSSARLNGLGIWVMSWVWEGLLVMGWLKVEMRLLVLNVGLCGPGRKQEWTWQLVFHCLGQLLSASNLAECMCGC